MKKLWERSWWISAFAAVALSGVCAPAQEPSAMTTPPGENTVQAWLRSGEPRLQAWGAFYAGRSGSAGWTSDLVAMLREWEPLAHPANVSGQSDPQPTAAQRQSRDAMAAVLDALIELKAQVPVELLRKTALDLPDETVVLTARVPPGEAEPLLLEWWHGAATPNAYYGESGMKRVASAMLALHPPAHFAAELMRETHVAMRFEVYTPGHEMGMGEAIGCGAGAGVAVAPKDWPAITHYTVHETSADGDEDPVLIAGIDPIRLHTHVGLGYERTLLTVYLGDRIKARLVAQMLRVEPRSLPWWQGRPEGIAYLSDAQYESEVRANIAAKEAAFATTLADLRSQGLVSEEEAGKARPQIDATVMDYRQSLLDALRNSGPKLPEVAVRETNVHWLKDVWSAAGAWQ